MKVSFRTLRSAAVAGLTASALLVVPAAAKPKQAKPKYPWNAKIDCGAGTIKVGSGNDIWSPLVASRTGHKYRPVGWDLKAGSKLIHERKPGTGKRKTMKCSYVDKSAKGTVIVIKRKP
jgi:hypothetical protein